MSETKYDEQMLTLMAFTDVTSAWRNVMCCRPSYPWIGEFMVQPFDRQSFSMYVKDALDRDEEFIKLELSTDGNRVDMCWSFDVKEGKDKENWKNYDRWVTIDIYEQNDWKRELAVQLKKNPYDVVVDDFESQENVMWMSKYE
jgi:hypothetical protein